MYPGQARPCLQVAHNRSVSTMLLHQYLSNSTNYSTASCEYSYNILLLTSLHIKTPKLKDSAFPPQNSLNTTLKYQLVWNALWRRPAPSSAMYRHTLLAWVPRATRVQESDKPDLCSQVNVELGDPCSKQCTYLQIQKCQTFLILTHFKQLLSI